MAKLSRLGPLASTSRLVALASLMAIVAANDATAQGRRARLSEDLAQKLDAGDARATSVILTGSQAKVDALAARHGLRVTRRLNGGAVVDVPAGALTPLSQDGEVDQLASNAVVRSTMEVTNEAIGASLLHGRLTAGPRALIGRGIGVAVIDSGVANRSRTARPPGGQRGLHGHQRAR